MKRADDLARLEAAAIDGLSGRRPLRLHVVVDCRTNTAARIVGEASRRYKEKYGSKVWSYTHAWRVVDRKSWGDAVSVLASCEKPSDIPTAMSRGYAVAIVVTEFPSTKAFDVVAGIKAIPCPAQTRHKTCSECRLCLDADRLLGSKLAIAFEPHGSKAGAVRKTLVALDTI